ncbi:hypothetical protein ABZ177_23670 [Streptomyces sp. NPDC006284]|uniref:hypothetical protein n=1 Tax=Streptomyces sp. NPDC006284 TaxID=3156742 RepID=UPI0033A4DE81
MRCGIVSAPYGSDWPYAPGVKSARFATMLDDFALTDAQRHAINRGTAEALFPRLADRSRTAAE